MYEQTVRSLCARLLALVLPDPAAAAARSALIAADPARYVRERDGQPARRSGAFRPAALAEYERCIALPGTCHVDLRGLPRQRRHRPRARPRRHRGAAVAWRSRCACSGANTARWAAASTCWRCGASAPIDVQRPRAACGHYIAEELPDARDRRGPRFFQITTGDSMSIAHRIAVIAGDGIGKEVMPEGLRVLEAAARRFDIALAVRPLRLCRAATTTRSTARCCPTTGRSRSAATTRSTSAPSAGRRRCPTMCRSGARC